MIINPLVSVIIPVYNGEKYLVQAIESVINEAYRPVEIIVIDDGSSDNTAKIIGQYGEIQYIYQSHRGVAAARNRGIVESGGEVIAFLDSDDFWPSGRLAAAVEYFLQYPDIGYVLGKQVIFVEPGCRIPPWMRQEWLEEPQDASNTGVLVVRKETFERVGMFNEDTWGGFLIWSMGTRHQVFIDGRADIYEYSGVLTDYVRIISLDRRTPELLQTYHLKACLLHRGTPLGTYFEALPGWKRVYKDQISTIFARSEAVAAQAAR